MFTPEALLCPSAFPHATDELQLHETHLSWVILTGAYAYKIKKPVKLPFVDCSLLEQRRILCEAELRLNRRLAAPLYLDVVPITWSGDRFVVGGGGAALEYAVRMRQFDRTQELDSLLSGDGVRPEELREFAGVIAQFHADAAVAPCGPGRAYADRLRDAVLGNIATLLGAWSAPEAPGELGRLVDWVHDAVHDALARLGRREEAGRIRECHGDLHARNIVRWNGRLMAFDCLEFDPALRWIDVMDDVAFLFMDLLSHERPDLAYSFLDRYLELTGDHGGLEFLPLYAVHRALVRAMVDALSAQIGSADGFNARLRRRIRAALALIDRPPPRLILMHGTSGSGKSWLSRQLTLPLHAIRLSSDIERRRNPPGCAPADRYSPPARREVYARLESAAAACLRGGFSVIVDATFLTADERHPFSALAGLLGVECMVVACASDLGVQRRRIERRHASGQDASEADIGVLVRQLPLVVPPGSDEAIRRIDADTEADDVVARVLAQIVSGITTPASAAGAAQRLP